jgi:hypothetical protein
MVNDTGYTQRLLKPSNLQRPHKHIRITKQSLIKRAEGVSLLNYDKISAADRLLLN